MVFKTLLTIGSLLFLLLLLITYHTKKYNLKLNDKIYRSLLVLTVLLLVTELAYVVFFELVDSCIAYIYFYGEYTG